MGTNRIPDWLLKDDSTRKRSNKQENSLAKRFGGKKTCNSGATFGENDVETPELSIEAKTTDKKSYILKAEEFKDIMVKTPQEKIPTQIIEFKQHSLELAVIELAELERLLSK